MPSMPCAHCTKIKRCRMYHDPERQTVEYLCRPCARALGYLARYAIAGR